MHLFGINGFKYPDKFIKVAKKVIIKSAHVHKVASLSDVLLLPVSVTNIYYTDASSIVAATRKFKQDKEHIKEGRSSSR
jgi:hypothetical protein